MPATLPDEAWRRIGGAPALCPVVLAPRHKSAAFGLVRQLLDGTVLGGAGQPQDDLFEGAARMALPREFLSFLARRVGTLPVLLVVATRPASESGRALVRSLVLDPGAAVLRLAPLGLASVEAMVREALGSAGAQELDAACLSATRGNTLLLGELLRDVRTRELPDALRTG